MKSYQQYEIDFPWLTCSQETDQALQVLETPNIYEIHPHHQQRITELAHQIAHANLQPGQEITNPQKSQDLIRTLLQERAEECMAVLFLDTKHRVIAFEELFPWSIDSATVHTRVLVKKALEHNAGAMVVAHNHPSGISEPSHADELLTKRISEAMALIEVRLLDHIIVSINGTTSMAELGLV